MYTQVTRTPLTVELDSPSDSSIDAEEIPIGDSATSRQYSTGLPGASDSQHKTTLGESKNFQPKSQKSTKSPEPISIVEIVVYIVADIVANIMYYNVLYNKMIQFFQ